eukprot:scaffold255_cov264-Prasinococcus_capsulatus_cf.AAC.7
MSSGDDLSGSIVTLGHTNADYSLTGSSDQEQPLTITVTGPNDVEEARWENSWERTFKFAGSAAGTWQFCIANNARSTQEVQEGGRLERGECFRAGRPADRSVRVVTCGGRGGVAPRAGQHPLPAAAPHDRPGHARRRPRPVPRRRERLHREECAPSLTAAGCGSVRAAGLAACGPARAGEIRRLDRYTKNAKRALQSLQAQQRYMTARTTRAQQT